METTYRRFPIGIQNFEQLRNNNCVYIDKTELIYKLTHSDSVYFLSRPREYKNFWFSTGTPTFLIELLQEADFNVSDLEGVEVSFETPSYSIKDPVPTLYLHGYLTIKGYDPMFGLYKLGFPNDDVREGVQDWSVNFDSATRTIGQWKVAE